MTTHFYCIIVCFWSRYISILMLLLHRQPLLIIKLKWRWWLLKTTENYWFYIEIKSFFLASVFRVSNIRKRKIHIVHHLMPNSIYTCIFRHTWWKSSEKACQVFNLSKILWFHKNLLFLVCYPLKTANWFFVSKFWVTHQMHSKFWQHFHFRIYYVFKKYC